VRAPRVALLLAIALSALFLGACSHAPRTAVEPDAPPASPAPREAHATHPPSAGTAHAMAGVERGKASYYADAFEGLRTANGETYSGQALTAAHRTLPFGTRVRVTNLANGKSIEVVINDRGPHRPGRIIDLSRRAAEAIDLVRQGLAVVRLEVVPLTAEDLH